MRYNNILLVCLFAVLFSGTAKASVLNTARPLQVGVTLVDDSYHVHIQSSELNKKLRLKKPEKSILKNDFKVTIVDADENGNTIFKHWYPSAEDIKSAEDVFIDDKSQATLRFHENNQIFEGIVDGLPITYNHNKKDFIIGKQHPTNSDYLDIPGMNISSSPSRPRAQLTSSVRAVIETVIICDKEFGDVFGHNLQNILNYWVVYMWDVNMRYKSLPSNDISFQINGVVVIANPGGQPFIEESRAADGRAEFGRILNRYTSWVYTQRGNLPPFDMAPLVTNTRLEWGGGLAWMGGTCNLDNNSKKHWGTLVFSDGGSWGSVTVGAHEMGHNVGAPHDDDEKYPGGCSDRGYIMSGGNDDLKWFFSSCSDRTISDFVRSDSASCLRSLASTKPAINPNFDNPKAPSLDAQCKKMRGSQAWVEPGDTNNCKSVTCKWRDAGNPNVIWLQGFAPVDNSECANGGRCLRGYCRKPGQLFKNIGSGLCMKASNPFNYGAAFQMVSCPSPGTPLDRLLVVQANTGSVLASQFVMGKEVGERCGYTGNAEGNIIWTDRCNLSNPTNSWHGWDFQDVGNGQFLLKHRISGRCAKPENRREGSNVKTYGACNKNDADMKWQRIN